MAPEALQGAVGGLQASEGTVRAATEKLKTTLRRQEQLQQRQGESNEARCAELRGLIQAVVEQMRPLHDTARISTIRDEFRPELGPEAPTKQGSRSASSMAARCGSGSGSMPTSRRPHARW